MTPLELLREELYKYERAVEKSKIAFKADKISLSKHKSYVKNLQPRIASYKFAIALLIPYFDTL